MPGKLPFVGRIFWKTLVVVFVLGAIAFAILVGTEIWELDRTNVVGATICLLILSYLIHLWLLPGEYHVPEQGEGTPEGETPTDEDTSSDAP
jgi:hypothetical protein